MERELSGYDVVALADKGRNIWNASLGKIDVKGGDTDSKRVFYTSLYRVFERPVCISEDGRYFSAFDHRVHNDYGLPFYTDDWIWDTYRAAHPLRVLIDQIRSWTSFGPICVWQNRWERCGCLLSRKLQEILDE